MNNNQQLLFVYNNFVMIRQDMIKNLSNSLHYFNSLSPEKIDHKFFEQNLNAIQAFISNRQISSSCPKQFLDNIFTILISKYYQIYSQSSLVISEQYLQNKYISVVKGLYQDYMDKDKLPKNIFALCLSANINKLKQEIKSNLKNNQSVITLFKFNLSLIKEIVIRKDYKISEYYPRCMSILSNYLRKQNVGLKLFQLILQTTKVLIQSNESFYSSNEKQQSQLSVQFQRECVKRLSEDVDYLINNFYSFLPNFKLKLKPFSQFLLNFYHPVSSDTGQLQQIQKILNNPNEPSSTQNKLFSSIVLLAQMNQIKINLHQYQFFQIQTIQQSYRQLFLQGCKEMIKIEVSIESKKDHFHKLSYLLPFIDIIEEQNSQLTNGFLAFIREIFKITKNHQLIKIPYYNETIPLEAQIKNYKQVFKSKEVISAEYRKQFLRNFISVIPFYQLQLQLASQLKKLLQSLNSISRTYLLRHFTDCLLEQQYRLDMSLTKLYNYLSILFAIKFLIVTSDSSFRWFQLAYTIFQLLGSKTDSVKKLKASFIEEELLIAVTLELINYSYNQLKKNYQQRVAISNKIKLTQSTIVFIQKILNYHSEQSYLIRLMTTSSLLQFTQNRPIQQSLSPIQAALIHRNKNNLDLMLNILSLSALNQVDYEQLAEYYMSHRNCERVLIKLLPKVSIETCRKCILTVQKWWLLLTAEIIEYLNNKQMKKSENEENFYVKDGENVVIKNALGVIILQLSTKWAFYLQSEKRQAIVDIILNMAKINPNMVFFKSQFNNIIKHLTIIINCCLGVQMESGQNPRSNNKNFKQQKVAIKSQKVDFYDRLRFKVYEIFISLPQASHAIFEPELLTTLRQILQKRHDQVKKDYLFNNNHNLKKEYQLGKLILAKFQS